MKQFIVILFYISKICFALHLPAYMQKCSLSDPNISECIKEKSNLALPTFVKGDSTYGVPVLSPLHHPWLKLFGDNFRLTLTNIHFDDFKNFKISDVKFDLENKRAFSEYRCSSMNFSSDYTIDNSKILTRTVHGGGHSEIGLVNNVLKFNCGVDKQMIDGSPHIKVFDRNIDLTPERVYFSFENLLADDGGEDINAFINEHWDVVFNLIKPGLEDFFASYIQLSYQAIGRKVPLNEIFSP